MSNPTTDPGEREVARTHAQAAIQLRRPFAPGAIGFRVTSSVPLNEKQYGGVHIAAYVTAKSIFQRLNAVVPGRWCQEFFELPASLTAHVDQNGQVKRGRKLYLLCRLSITLPDVLDGKERTAVYEDIGAMDAGNFEGLKTLYSDARKRAAVAAGIGTYLHTALREVILPEEQVVKTFPEQHDGRSNRPIITIPPQTEVVLRGGYERRIETDAVRAYFGEVFVHGERADDTGQDEATAAAAPADAESASAVPGRPEAPPAPAMALAHVNGHPGGDVPIEFPQ